MTKKHPWLFAGTTALALVFSQRALLAEEPPQEERIEIEVTESVQQAAEQATEAARAIAAEAAAEAQERAAEIAAEAAEQAREVAEEVVEEVTKSAGKAAKNFPLALDFTPAPYQIGLQVAPVSKALEAQLKLEGKGVLIDVVEKDGPGDRAGLKPHDIVITVAEQDVRSPADLSKTLSNSEGKELKFDVIRGGEKVTVMVEPRSAVKVSGSLNVNLDMPKTEIDEEILKLESKIREKLKGAGVDLRMHVIRPGQVMHGDVLLKRDDLPEGVSISVRKQGGKPAKIEVSRGEEKWEVSEDSLDKLPEDLRPHVERMLGRGPIGIGFPPNVKWTAPLPPGLVITAEGDVGVPVPGKHKTFTVAPKAARKVAVSEGAEFRKIEEQLKHISDDIKRLYDQIDELREDRKQD